MIILFASPTLSPSLSLSLTLPRVALNVIWIDNLQQLSNEAMKFVAQQQQKLLQNFAHV